MEPPRAGKAKIFTFLRFWQEKPDILSKIEKYAGAMLSFS